MDLFNHRILLDMQALIRKGNSHKIRQQLREKLRIAGDNGFELLHTALSIELGKMPKATPEPSKKQAMECKICKKYLPNGINSWVGAKRSCKESCTRNDLIPCQ